MPLQSADLMMVARGATPYKETLAALASFLHLNAVMTGALFIAQGAPTAKSATGTLTIAELLTGIIQSTSASAVSYTLPTGTLSDAGILAGALPVNEAVDWVLINTGSATGAATLVAGTGHTIVGAAVTAIGTSSRWRTRKTAANTFITYRIG